MATTITVNSNWKGFVGKVGFTSAQDASKVKEAVICIAIGACNVYPAANAGYTVDLSACGAIKTILFVDVEPAEVGTNTALITQYVRATDCAAATGTLHFYETAIGVVCGCANIVAAPFAELPACATDAECETIRVHVLGF